MITKLNDLKQHKAELFAELGACTIQKKQLEKRIDHITNELVLVVDEIMQIEQQFN